MQQVKAGLKAIYLSGWQVAADANIAGEMYPDQSLYPANSVPQVVKRINNTLLRADQLHHAEGKDDRLVLQPIVADAEAGFGGVLNAFELMKAMIEAGAAGVHFEDQLASVKKCGHMGGKVLVPTREAVEKLTAARLAADVMGVPTLIVARTDAEAADLLTSDVDDNDKPFCTGERTVEGFYKTEARPGPGDQPWPGLRAVRRPGLVRDRQAGPGIRRQGSPRRSTPSSRARCWPTTARPASTGRRTSTTPPSRSSRRKSPATATSSSSSPWPVSTR
jgi:isocitrate lyase